MRNNENRLTDKKSTIRKENWSQSETFARATDIPSSPINQWIHMLHRAAGRKKKKKKKKKKNEKEKKRIKRMKKKKN